MAFNWFLFSKLFCNSKLSLKKPPLTAFFFAQGWFLKVCDLMVNELLLKNTKFNCRNYNPCFSLFILVCICKNKCKQVSNFLILVYKTKYKYSFGICPRSKTRIKKWYSPVLRCHCHCYFYFIIIFESAYVLYVIFSIFWSAKLFFGTIPLIVNKFWCCWPEMGQWM